MSIFRKPLAANPAVAAVDLDNAADDGAEPTAATHAGAELAAASNIGATPVTALRYGSKAAALVELMAREEGASLDEMIRRTGWQGHTVRAAMTGLRKKGHVIDKRTSGNCTVWFIAAGAPA